MTEWMSSEAVDSASLFRDMAQAKRNHAALMGLPGADVFCEPIDVDALEV